MEQALEPVRSLVGFREMGERFEIARGDRTGGGAAVERLGRQRRRRAEPRQMHRRAASQRVRRGAVRRARGAEIDEFLVRLTLGQAVGGAHQIGSS